MAQGPALNRSSPEVYSHGISCRLSNAENRAILSVLVSQAVSYLLTQSHSRGGTSEFWCIGGKAGEFVPFREFMNDPANRTRPDLSRSQDRNH